LYNVEVVLGQLEGEKIEAGLLLSWSQGIVVLAEAVHVPVV